MSLMNIMSATLLVLIIGAGVALFLGTRASDAAEVYGPVFTPSSQDVMLVQDDMEVRSDSFDIAAVE